MNNRVSKYLLLCILLLAASIALNIFLSVKNSSLNDRINTFLPAAMHLEDENKLMKEAAVNAQHKIEQLENFQDSILYSGNKTAPITMHDTLAQPVQNMDPALDAGRMFKDLNKGKP